MGMLDWLQGRKERPEAQAATVYREKAPLERASELRAKIKEQVGGDPKRKTKRGSA